MDNLKYNEIHDQFPLNYMRYIFYFCAVCYSILHVYWQFMVCCSTNGMTSIFHIVNFPFICSNIPAVPAYGVYISQLMQYSRDCGTYQDILDRGFVLTRKLRNQAFLLVQLKSSLRKFNDHHHDLVDHYGISVSQMTTDMFHLS